MGISSVGSVGMSMAPKRSNQGFMKVKEAFDDLGSALDSGNLDDAKKALATLKENAPPKQGDGNDPIGQKMEELSKAVESGDLDAAKQAYSEVKQLMAERKPQQGQGGGPKGGMPAGGGRPSGGSQQVSSSSESSESDSSDYDPADTNKDGEVSFQERIAYMLKQAEDNSQNSQKGQIDLRI
jgi:soluble cytochrome b562